MLDGSGGNITVLTGPDGKVLVDAGIPASRAALTKVLDGLGSQPIKHVINTHWHFDHTDGNEWLHSLGAEIVAHEKTRERMSTSTRVEDWNFTFPPSADGALPTRLLQDEETLQLDGSAIALKHYGPAHTDTDLSVYFEDADVLCAGDTWWNPYYPFMDYSTGGSIDGHIRAAAANVARAGAKTIVVPGHGRSGGKAELVAFHDMLLDVREKVARLKAQGRSLKEVVAAKPTARYDAKFGGFVVKGAAFAGLVYAGV
jgi:glyoxylase-like metal-dependent hydrolase (beta-lactamase superfamily II)